MKYTLILPIVALALFAFVTPDAATEPCSAQEGDIAMAASAVASAEAALELAEKKQSAHITLDHFLSSSSQQAICVTCMENYLSINQAKAAVKAAKDAHADKVEARDACLSSYTCDSCGEFGDHFVSPQPSCTHMVYSCQSDANTHNQVVCSGCNATYWQCGSSASNHRQVTCSSERAIEWFGNGGAKTGTANGCGATYWKCKDSSAHSILSISYYFSRVCLQSGSSGSSSSSGGGGGGGSGGSTPPATTPSTGSGGGGGGGDSGSRVRCGNGSSCRLGGYASSSTAHQSTCDLGHIYWRCGHPKSVNLHSVRHSNRTCRRCGTTFNSRTNGRCTSRSGTTYRWHWE